MRQRYFAGTAAALSILKSDPGSARVGAGGGGGVGVRSGGAPWPDPRYPAAAEQQLQQPSSLRDAPGFSLLQPHNDTHSGPRRTRCCSDAEPGNVKLKASGGAEGGGWGESANVPAGWERREWGMKKEKKGGATLRSRRAAFRPVMMTAKMMP
ncbi:hypothetical protein EYF80_044601 [Liparis tanakae]|uniref:Uncharacterized protein n=1 Tax=Liparis tanakae TaxID=230148 RepID=A0A4Z2FW95_9TELE|nr:hypothetical protein EYF80_044601 [Liparis tanakae]